MYTTHHIFPVLPIKKLINQDGEPTTPRKLSTDTNTSVSNIRVLYCTCILLKTTANVGGKALNIRHQSQEQFWGIFVGITKKSVPHILTYYTKDSFFT